MFSPELNQVPVKTLVIDGSCRVEDRGLKAHHGHVSGLSLEFLACSLQFLNDILSITEEIVTESWFFSLIQYKLHDVK